MLPALEQDLASREAAQPVAANSAPAGDGALRDSSADLASADVSGAAAALDAREAEQLSAMEGAPAGRGGTPTGSRARREFFVMHRMAQYRCVLIDYRIHLSHVDCLLIWIGSADRLKTIMLVHFF